MIFHKNLRCIANFYNDSEKRIGLRLHHVFQMTGPCLMADIVIVETFIGRVPETTVKHVARHSRPRNTITNPPKIKNSHQSHKTDSSTTSSFPNTDEVGSLQKLHETSSNSSKTVERKKPSQLQWPPSPSRTEESCYPTQTHTTSCSDVSSDTALLKDTDERRLRKSCHREECSDCEDDRDKILKYKFVCTEILPSLEPTPENSTDSRDILQSDSSNNLTVDTTDKIKILFKSRNSLDSKLHDKVTYFHEHQEEGTSKTLEAATIGRVLPPAIDCGLSRAHGCGDPYCCLRRPQNRLFRSASLPTSTNLHRTAFKHCPASDSGNRASGITLLRHYYPEGGWGWLVLAVAVATSVLAHGLHTAFGALVRPITVKFQVVSYQAGE